jgi:hypothetical protein
LVKDCPDASKKRKKYTDRNNKNNDDDDVPDGEHKAKSAVIFPAHLSGDTLDDNLAVSLKPMKKPKLL